MKTSKILTPKTKYLFLACTLMCSQFLMADPTSKITEWGEIVKTALNAVVVIFAVVGGFIIFLQYMQGNEQAQKNFIKFVIGLAIFGMVKLIGDVFIPTT